MNHRPWNDDERNTHDYIKSSRNLNNNSKDIKYESIVKVIQEYHKELYNEIYIYKDTNYKRENKLAKPKSTYMFTYVNNFANHNNKKYTDNDNVEKEEDQEFNNDILDKQIYKKCWYS
jgi:hypothetical protein